MSSVPSHLVGEPYWRLVAATGVRIPWGFGVGRVDPCHAFADASAEGGEGVFVVGSVLDQVDEDGVVPVALDYRFLGSGGRTSFARRPPLPRLPPRVVDS